MIQVFKSSVNYSITLCDGTLHKVGKDLSKKELAYLFAALDYYAAYHIDGVVNWPPVASHYMCFTAIALHSKIWYTLKNIAPTLLDFNPDRIINSFNVFFVYDKNISQSLIRSITINYA